MRSGHPELGKAWQTVSWVVLREAAGEATMPWSASEQPHRSMGNPRFLIKFGDGIGLATSRNVIKVALSG